MSGIGDIVIGDSTCEAQSVILSNGVISEEIFVAEIGLSGAKLCRFRLEEDVALDFIIG